jgi:hypothetical protein
MTKHIVNPDKIINYPLNTNPERSINLPFKYAYRARKLLNLALDSGDMKECNKKVSLLPSLKGVYIPKKVTDFVGKEFGFFISEKMDQSFKLFDKAYLETCLYMAKDDLAKNNVLYGKFGRLESGAERMEKIRSIENIKRTLESL